MAPVVKYISTAPVLFSGIEKYLNIAELEENASCSNTSCVSCRYIFIDEVVSVDADTIAYTPGFM